MFLGCGVFKMVKNIKWIIASIMVVLFLANCANYYQYKYLKNTNSSKKTASFRKDKANCDVIAQKRAGVFNNLTYSGITPGDKITKLYEKCMYRKGWRKK
jgi:hypothetical protein